MIEIISNNFFFITQLYTKKCIFGYLYVFYFIIIIFLITNPLSLLWSVLNCKLYSLNLLVNLMWGSSQLSQEAANGINCLHHEILILLDTKGGALLQVVV